MSDVHLKVKFTRRKITFPEPIYIMEFRNLKHVRDFSYCRTLILQRQTCNIKIKFYSNCISESNHVILMELDYIHRRTRTHVLDEHLANNNIT